MRSKIDRKQKKRTIKESSSKLVIYAQSDEREKKKKLIKLGSREALFF